MFVFLFSRFRLHHLLTFLVAFLFLGACESPEKDNHSASFNKAAALLREADTLQKNTPDLIRQQSLVKRALAITTKKGHDSLTAEAQLKLGHYCLLQVNDSAVYHLKKAKTLFQKLGLSNRLIRCDAAFVNFYSKKAAFDEATPYIIDAELRIRESGKPTEDHIYYYLQKTIFYHSLGLSDSAMLTVNKGQELCERIQNDKYLPNLMASRAIIYSVLGDFKKSIVDQKNTLNGFSPVSTDRAIVYTNIGNNFARLHLPDSAEVYYDKALAIYQKINIGELAINKFHNTAASSLLESDKVACQKHFTKVDPQKLTLPNQFYYRYIKANLQTTSAARKAGLIDAIAFADSAALPMDDLKKDCYFELSELAEATGNSNEALRYYKRFTELNDRVRGQEMGMQLEQLRLVNHIREKETTIKNQQQVIAQKSKTISQQSLNTWLIVSLGAIFILMIILVLLNYRKKARISHLLLEQNKLESELLITAVSPISGQLETAAGLLRAVKKETVSEPGNKQQSIRSAIDQWLLSYSDQTALVDASKEHERAFLRKLDQFPNLSETEKRVVILIRQGYQSKEIAARLSLALNTVEIYRSNVRKKLQVPANEQLNNFIRHL